MSSPKRPRPKTVTARSSRKASTSDERAPRRTGASESSRKSADPARSRPPGDKAATTSARKNSGSPRSTSTTKRGTTGPGAAATSPVRTRAAARPEVARPTSRGRHYRRSWRLPVGRSGLRIRAFMVLLAVLITAVVGRAFQLQAIDAQAFADEASVKMQNTRELQPTRGVITDRNGVVLAETEPAVWITVDPDMVMTNGADKRYRMSQRKQEEAEAAPLAVAEILAKHLGGSVNHYLEIVTTPDSRYQSVERRVPAATYTAIQADMRAGFDGEGARPWHGVFATPDPIRTYPNAELAGNVIGFVNGEGQGVAGMEGAFDEQLRGEPGQEIFDASTYGRIPLGENVITPAQDGYTYELTLDADLQWLSERALADGVAKAGAKTGKLVVMDVNSGELLALANYPSYDPANPGAVADTGDLGNRAVSDMFEPGSTQKILTMAALADAGLITPDTEVQVPERIASGAGYVSDSWTHGTINLNARGIMAQSSNIGTIMLARTMPKAEQQEYLASFGLGARTGVELPAEASGVLPPPDMADYTRDQISFGQGLSVTAVQMAAAAASVVNGGIYHQPTIIKGAIDAEGNEVELPGRQTRRVISEEASEMVVNMMEAVITLRDGREIAGYRTAGKSGTAQRFDPNCNCYNGFTASFVGAAPAEDPQVLVYVVLDQPTRGNLGSVLALPVVNNVLQVALPRYNVRPSTTEAPDDPITFE